jgi:putative ABC transport system permease protein
MQALGIQLVSGRFFTDADTAESPPVTIINETMARRYFPDGEGPVGRRIQRGGPNPSLPWTTIVGVVSDVKYRGLDAKEESTIYVPITQVWSRTPYLILKGATNPKNLAAAVRSEIWSLDKGMSVTRVKTLQDLLYESVAEPRFRTLLLGVFAALALVLAAVGIYGVISYSVGQRTQEIGIRMALGAQRGDVLRLVVRQGLTLASIGVVIGLTGAVLASRVLSSLLYGITATDPATFVIATIALFAVALLASFIPANRATKVDPVNALRYQ